MKKVFCLLTAIIMTLTMTFNVCAQVDLKNEDNLEEVTVIKMMVQDNEVSMIGVARGQLISSIELDLVNEGFGVAGISAVVLCHEAMERIKLNIYFEKFDGKSWKLINRKEFTWTEDEVDDELIMAAVSYKVGALTNGEYRLRASASAKDLDSTLSEAMTAKTTALVFD